MKLKIKTTTTTCVSSSYSLKISKKNMVEAEEDKILCFIRDQTPNSTQKKLSLYLRSHNTVSELFDQISTQFQYKEFELALSNGLKNVILNDEKYKTLKEIGLNFEKDVKNVFIISPLSNPENIATSVERKMSMNLDTDDVIVASSSGTELDTSNMPLPAALPMLEGVDSITSNYKSLKLYSAQRPAVGYVGLVNQAMTCYLNSLIQALFMTPEFRNALYNWEYDKIEENKSIPYQLQKLFLNLQTSSKLSVETTDLTKSFGWDSTEAWQQHDIQELCRVMFDALEQKFKNTKQADLINRLYEGKMIDYVKCLDCGTMKTKEDTFLDIPLPVRPFGSAVAYNSIEEAMRAFVQPETLDGNNQYFCEKCNKKCDAHKGLKFSKFPYILTLHLKRFDFDYQTFHRIKLNDKVTFPQTLDLNQLINSSESASLILQTPATNGDNGISENESVESALKLNDDCSTTDSGSALDEDGAIYTHGQNIEADLQEDDEGIDMTTSTEKLVRNTASGPYIYELFAIMIHSGSASGGHYYAYIKDFESNEWYCFNDQTVSTITQEDISKSFGGGASRAYYSGAYSSSTNAYMLMYRQVDRQRNCLPIKADVFPAHINNLLQKLKEKEEFDKQSKDYEIDIQKYKIFYYNTKLQRMVDCKVYMSNESTLEEALQEAYNRLNLEDIAPIERCRLVAYTSTIGQPEVSFEGREKDEINEIMAPFEEVIVSSAGTLMKELLLEIRDENAEFEVYIKDEIVLKVYTVDVETSDIDGPHQIRCMLKTPITDLKKLLGKKLELNTDKLILSMLKSENDARILDTDDIKLEEYIKEKHELNKLFVTVAKNSDDITSKLKRLVERFDHIITLYFVLPNLDKDSLDKLGIPPYEPPTPEKTNKCITPTKLINELDEVDAMMLAKPTSATTSAFNIPHNGSVEGVRRTSPLPPNETDCNSEDSSLSDSDRTLVESVHELNCASSTSHSPVNSDYQLSSPDNFMLYKDSGRIPDVYDSLDQSKVRSLYFKAQEYCEPTCKIYLKPLKMLKVLADRSMLIGKLKEHLQPVLKVPMVYFKIFRISSVQTETECTRMTEGLNTFKDGERLIIELGRVLRKGEYKLKVYYLNLSEVNDDTERCPFICEWIFRSGASVGQTKRELLASIALLDPKYDIPYEKCRLRKKNCKNPAKIFLDDEKFYDDISLSTTLEVIVQDLRDGNSQECVSRDDIVLFVRKWIPSEMGFGPHQEVTIKRETEFKKILSDLSGIPIEFIEYAKLNGSFYRYSISVVSVHTNLSWSQAPVTFDDWPMGGPQDGHIYYYRDSREQLKELTPEERRALNGRENTRIERLSSTASTYSPRKERALKIYVDASPKKHED